MPWFRNHYVCFACEAHWLAERAAAEHADCPQCRAYDVAPYKSDDWSVVIEADGDAFVVLECAAVNAHGPDYRPLGRFPDRTRAQAFLAAGRNSPSREAAPRRMRRR